MIPSEHFHASAPVDATAAEPIEYLYHQAWEFIGTPEQRSSNRFQVALHYRSLVTDRAGSVEFEMPMCETAAQALDLAWKEALSWAQKHKGDAHHGCG